MWDVRQARPCLSLVCPHMCWSVCRSSFTLYFIIYGFLKKKKEKKTFIQPQPLLLIYHYLLFTRLPSLTAKMKNVKLRRDFVISQPTDSFRYLDRVLSHLPYFCPSVFSFLVPQTPLPPKKKTNQKTKTKINLTTSSWRMSQFLKCISRTDERGAIRQEEQVYATCFQDMWQNRGRACGKSHSRAARRSTITVSCCLSYLSPSYAQ